MASSDYCFPEALKFSQFNRKGGCFTACNSSSIFIFNPRDPVPRFSLSSTAKIAILHESTPLLLYVSVEESKSLSLYDCSAESDNLFYKIKFDSEVLQCETTSDFILVATVKVLHVFDILTLEHYHDISIPENIVFSSSRNSTVVCPSVSGGFMIIRINKVTFYITEISNPFFNRFFNPFYMSVIENVVISNSGKYVVLISKEGINGQIYDMRKNAVTKRILFGNKPRKFSSFFIDNNDYIFVGVSISGSCHLVLLNHLKPPKSLLMNFFDKIRSQSFKIDHKHIKAISISGCDANNDLTLNYVDESCAVASYDLANFNKISNFEIKT